MTTDNSDLKKKKIPKTLTKPHVSVKKPVTYKISIRVNRCYVEFGFII